MSVNSHSGKRRRNSRADRTMKKPRKGAAAKRPPYVHIKERASRGPNAEGALVSSFNLNKPGMSDVKIWAVPAAPTAAAFTIAVSRGPKGPPSQFMCGTSLVRPLMMTKPIMGAQRLDPTAKPDLSPAGYLTSACAINALGRTREHCLTGIQLGSIHQRAKEQTKEHGSDCFRFSLLDNTLGYGKWLERVVSRLRRSGWRVFLGEIAQAAIIQQDSFFIFPLGS